MNAFADTLLTFLLGWVKGLAQRVMGFVTGGEGAGFLVWLGDHWLGVVLVICLGGIVIDILVWLLRWRPDLVWSTRLRHVREKLSGQKMRAGEEWDFYQGYEDAVPMLDDGMPYFQQEYDEAPAQEDYQQQEYWYELENPVQPEAPVYEYPPADKTPSPRRRRSEKYQKEKVNPLDRLRDKLMSTDDDENAMLDGLPPIVDSKQAFHEPIYPNRENNNV